MLSDWLCGLARHSVGSSPTSELGEVVMYCDTWAGKSDGVTFF